MLYPSDYVSSVDEYLPGFGVYTDDDSLFSANIGQLELDKINHVAKLRFATKISKMQGVGTITIGIIAQVKDSFAIVDVLPFYSKTFNLIPWGYSAILDISQVKRGYVKEMRDCVRIGDIVRVKIIEITKDSIKLSIQERNLGIIKAFCTACRGVIKNDGKRLVCSKCGAKQFRKTAEDYNSGKLI